MKTVFRAVIPLLWITAAWPLFAQISMQGTAFPDAPAPQSLLGVWGTELQCTHFANETHDHPIQPLIISEQWLQQGMMYCLIHWMDHIETDTGSQTLMYLQCGEDTLQDYRAQTRIENGVLQIKWSPSFTGPPMGRCKS